MKTQYEKSGDVAKRLDIHPNTVRNYADRFSEFMSDKATGTKRKFTHEDIIILATVVEFRERGQSWDDIETILRNGQRVDKIPSLPDPAEEIARQSVALVPKTEIDRLQDELNRITRERDNLLERLESIMATASQERLETIEQWQLQLDKKDSEIKELRDELGIAKGRLQEIAKSGLPTRLWLALFIVIMIALFLIGLLVVWNIR